MNAIKNNNKLLWLEYVAVAIIVIAFFVISRCGFYLSDDLAMAYGEFSSLFDVFKRTWHWYHTLGGRCFSVASQYLFCGLIGNKIWFDLVNTLFFLLLIMTSGKLINNSNSKGKRFFCVLLFALLFWFFCPVPSETLFWVAGSTTHLWGNTLAFVFLWFFLKNKDDNFSIVGKTGLFFMSIVAATEFIPCASICGAFVIFYAFHIRQFKGNVVPFVVGFAIGSVLLLFAPGSFRRAELLGGISFIGKIRGLLNHLGLEIVKYKALWMLLVVLFCGWIKDKEAVKSWMRSNSVLLLSLGWSVVAFSIVFRPANRALFFPETLSLVLFLKFLFDNYQMFLVRFLDNSKSIGIIRSAVIMLLFVVFIVDSAFAVIETKNQRNNNDVMLNKIKASGGIVALDKIISSHRMAYVACFPEWTWKPLADEFGLDSVHVYPFYCQEKFYKNVSPLENVAVLDWDWGGTRLIVRIEDRNLQESNNHVTFTIDYTRPRKWYKSWLDKVRNYKYNRTMVVEKYEPDACFDGYCYYMIWFNRENVKGLKSIKYEIE